ncbi:MAG: class I SAM-dependent methyltransferase, partial [Deltaproteobacteria bacterium]|nr:class I SAM-dependent methyltransferase [Deltaproteobacteria bacterium]
MERRSRELRGRGQRHRRGPDDQDGTHRDQGAPREARRSEAELLVCDRRRPRPRRELPLDDDDLRGGSEARAHHLERHVHGEGRARGGLRQALRGSLQGRDRGPAEGRRLLSPRLDYDRVASDYGKSRALPLDAIASWHDAIARHLSLRPGLRVADVGSGAGTFANAFADWFGARVVALEPSAGMRREAVRKGLLPGIVQVGAAGEALPLASGSCDAAWLSTVIHHLRDREACAREL